MAARLPSPLALFHPPQTPYDRCQRALAPAFVLLTEAAAVLPAGARVVVTSEPPNASFDTSLHHLGIALLPGRTVIPAARYQRPRPDLVRQADYIVVVGPAPKSAPGERLLERSQGTVWRRTPR